MKQNQVEGLDYQLVPKEQFLAFYNTFGAVDDDRDVIQRKVSLARDRQQTATLPVVPTDTVRTLGTKAVQALGLGQTPHNRLRFYIHHQDEDRYELLTIEMKTNWEHFFTFNQVVLIDVLDDEGNGVIQPPAPRSRNGPSMNGGGSSHRWLPFFFVTLHGVLWTIVAPIFSQYFLSGHYKGEVNEQNPLGTGGDLAHAFADLLEQLWSGENSSISPRQIKTVIGQIAPRFSGFSQQDSQELMAFVLDGLHEDLNRIKNKPYFADNDEDENKSDEELAKLQWDQYKARNDSIIVDKIHGQIKSTLTCPTCMKISIKFDPICFLSLPLPIPEKQFEQMFLLMQPDKKWALFAMKVTRSTTVPEATKIIQDDLAKSIEYKEKPIVLWKMDERQNVQFLRADDTVAINNSYSSYHQQQHHNKIYGIFVDSPEQQLMVVVKNQSVSNERPVTLPYVFAISPGVEINREWVDNVAMPTIRSEFFKDPQLVHDADEGVPYEIFFETPEGLSPLNEESIRGVSVTTLVIRWQNPQIFNGKDGKALVDRQCRVPVPTLITLKDCIDLFTKDEKLSENDSWYCPRCKEHKRATKRLDLWKLPDVLIIHLKRFIYDRWHREKIGIQVQIPSRGLELNDKLANDKHEHQLLPSPGAVDGIPVLRRNQPDAERMTSSTRCTLPTIISLDIAFAKVGTTEDFSIRIIGAYLSTRNQEVDLEVDRQAYFTRQIAFKDVTKAVSYKFAAIPHIDLRLPSDFFYPIMPNPASSVSMPMLYLSLILIVARACFY
ncbi:unnamed protein product, partial [Mesorhabditis spiculigera]